MLSAKLLSCLAVVSAIVMASCEAHAEVTDPDEGRKVLTSPSSAISQHDTTRSLRTANAAVAKENEERMELNPLAMDTAEKAMTAHIPLLDNDTVARQARTNTALRNAAGLNDNHQPANEDYVREAQKYLNTRDFFHQHHLELLKLQKKLRVEINEATVSREKDLVRDADKSKAAAVVGAKSSADMEAKDVVRDADKSKAAAVVGAKSSADMEAKDFDSLLQQLYKVEAEIKSSRIWYRLIMQSMKRDLDELKSISEKRVINQAGEGLAGDADKSKAAGGAHAGDHAAV